MFRDTFIIHPELASPSKSVRTSFAMSTFAGLAKFGLSDENGEVTLDVVGGK